MFRVLIVFILLNLTGQETYAQIIPPSAVFKNGRLLPENSLLSHNLNHPAWQNTRFGNNFYVIVQTDRMADSGLKNRMLKNGIQLQQFISGNNWLATCNPLFRNKNLKELSIRNIYSIPLSVKMNPRVLEFAANSKGTKDLIAVTCFPTERNMIIRELSAAGAQIIETKIKPANTWFIKGSPEIMTKLNSLPFIASINSIHMEDIPLNYNNRAIHGVQSLAATLGRNLRGNGVVVGIGDNADPSTHIDLSGKLIMRTDEPVDYHGTHTSGIIAGGGILNPLYTGMAPEVKLVVNDFSNIIVNSPTYVADYNMPLTNNSYYNGATGCPGEGEYNSLSYYVDSQLLANPKLLHVFAAGNDGSITCSPLPASFGTIKSGFQSAKNILSVGNMNNSSYIISYASSRGPAKDGRIKPEIVAGGVNITSTVINNSYATFSGTSMSSPTVTGILALITERYRQLHGGDNPEGALLKTLVTNSAEDLGNPGPDFTYGFGMISARTTVEALEQNHFFTGTLSDTSSQTFSLPSIPAGTNQLKVLLYWPDAPAISLAAGALVNDLDLTVTEPGGTTHLPLILDPSPAGVNNNAIEGADHLNNIEQVVISNPPAGTYLLNIKAVTIAAAPQKFYIAYEIIQPSVTLEYPFGTETCIPGQPENIRWSAYGGDTNTFTLEYSLDGGSSWSTISNAIPSNARSFIWTVPAVVTTRALIRISRNGTGYSGTSSFPFTILDQPLLTGTNTCPGYAQLIWNSIAGADSYDILQLSGDTMKVISQSTDTSWLATPLRKDSSYWFSVRAVHGGISGRRSMGVNIIPNTGPCTAGILDNDLMVDSVLVPRTGRQFTSSQPGIQRISIHVKNPGAQPTSSSLTFSFQVNGGPIVSEISPLAIAAHTSTVFTFSPANSYDFSLPGTYNVKTWVHYLLDTIPGNDTINLTIKNLRNDPLMLNPSFTEGFETASDRPYYGLHTGLDSLERSDFSTSTFNGRLNSFFNSGFARTGKRSMLLDVTEQGTNASDSLINTFNLSGYSASDQIWLDFYFKKQSPVPTLGGNHIWIRGNDQAPWIVVKSLSDPLELPGTYIKLNLDVTGVLAAASPTQSISSSFQVKCGYEGKTPAASSNPLALPGGGISFDDFMITKSQHDVAMVRIVQPVFSNICQFGNAEKISVLIKNYSTDSIQNIPVTYVVNQDTVTEIVQSLGPKDSLLYNFIKTADMSVYQTYHIKTWVHYANDNYRNNDSSGDYSFQTTPLISQFPYLEGFEKNNGYWFSGGQNSSWQWGKPAKTIIHKAANGSNAWVTNLNGNYTDNEYSFLYSPCFDLTSLQNPVLSFSHIFQTEDACSCDFHWVEYSLNDSSWTVLGGVGSGINWYDYPSIPAWQKSDPKWHVSSYNIPVIAPKIRFRIVMFSDPGTNYEGIGIDDVHLFEKAPVFTDSLNATLALPVSGNNWIDFEENGKRLFSINPGGQNLGNTRLSMFRDTSQIRDTASQYYGSRNWVVETANPPTSNVRVRYYFTDAEAKNLIQAKGCASCLNIEDAYQSGITQYSSIVTTEEDSSLKNNRLGTYSFHRPQQDVQIIPYDNGYYAETLVNGFSEFWINGGGKQQDHPLAAWLNEFSAVRSNASAWLNWSSWQELASEKYIIERSADSIVFQKIGEVPAVPHADSVLSYHFTDPQVARGNNFYRLVLYLQSGDSLVSPVRKIYYEPLPTSVQVYPNPTDGNITIKTPSTCWEIQIFDVLGRKMMDMASQGYQQQISITPFPPGVYFLKLFTDRGNKLIKLEKR